MNMAQFIANHWLDMLTTILGLAYIVLEYRASIWMWVVGFFMEALGIVLYYQKGLYADCGMEFYYLAMTIYGFIAWKSPFRKASGEHVAEKAKPKEMPITHIKKSLIVPWTLITLAIWGALYAFLVTCTDSRVPVADSFTTALSIVGIIALSHKYLEQWLIWIVVDAVTCVLYFYKDIPFKASLYGLYVVIAVMGYFKWKRMMAQEPAREKSAS